MSDQDTNADKTALLGLAALLIMPNLFIKGIVVVQLWKWFIMPIFEVPLLSIPAAIGLTIFTGYVTSRPVRLPDKREASEQASSLLMMTFFYPCVVMAIAWAVHKLM